MNRTAWKYYAGRYRGHRRRLVVVALVALAQFLLVLPTVFLVRHLFDTAIPRSDFGKLSLIGAALLGLNVANGVVSLWVRHVSLLVTKIVIREIRGQLLDCLYMFSRGFYDRSDRGKLHSVVVQDTERIDVMSNALIAQVLPSLPVCAAGTKNGASLTTVAGVNPFSSAAE